MPPESFNQDKELADFFTDVEPLRELFKDSVTAPTLTKRLLVIHGIGGVGKSSLLRMFRLHCRNASHVPVALASGDEAKSALDVLARWTEDLKADGITLPTFGRTYEHYRAIQAKVDEQAKKAEGGRSADIAGKAASKTAEAAGGALAGAAIGSVIPGIGTAIGGALGGVLGGMGAEALVDWLRGFMTKPDIDLLLDPTKKMTDDFLADIADEAKKKRIVLMLDTFEQMTALDDWGRDVAQRLPANVLLVIAGRALPNWSRAWDGWMADAQIEELKPMDEDVMRELIGRYYGTMRGGQPSPAQVEAIIQFARGLPMVVTSAVQLWVKYGVEDFESVRPEIVANLVDRLMEGVPSKLIPALEAAAIVRWFDQPILRAVMKQDDVRDVYNELRRFPFVRTRVEGLALHDAVREIMDENLRVQDSERHRDLHERAAEYFEKSLKNATGDEAERLGLERLYHRIRADEESGIKMFQEMAEELVRYRLVNRLRVLLNDANTYPLERNNSKIWRLYYDARFAHTENRFLEAEKTYQAIADNVQAEPKLHAYVLCDLAEIWSNTGEWNSQPKDISRAIDALELAQKLAPAIDPKLVHLFSHLRRINMFRADWERAIQFTEKQLLFFEQSNDKYELVYTLSLLADTFGLVGAWRRAAEAWNRIIDLRKQMLETRARSVKVTGYGHWYLVWSGNYVDAEREIKDAIAFARRVGDVPALLGLLREIGLVLGLQEKFAEATDAFVEELKLNEQIRPNRLVAGLGGIMWGFWGAILIKQGKLETAAENLERSLSMKTLFRDDIGIPELLVWSGELSEVRTRYLKEANEASDLTIAASKYQQCVDNYRWTGRRYFECGALTGLVRVKHAQGDYAAIPPMLAGAEQLAQQYEYNDRLASLRLTQGHIVWDGQIAEWGKGFDAALLYYQHALIYALRYNRFLLDEVLSGRPQGTPLRPIIPHCLERGEEGRKMLIALHDWWKTGANDIGVPRPDTISPILEGIALLEAEKIAREREPGDGLPQKTVLEQISAALS